jgi:hypothetical protein
MTHLNDIANRSARESARALLEILGKAGRVSAVPPRDDIAGALIALLRAAAIDPESNLTVSEKDGTITVRFATPKA